MSGLLIAETRKFCEETLQRPGMAFAYIEETTVFSLRISDSIGHAVQAEMPLVLFSRLNASSDDRVGIAHGGEAMGHEKHRAPL